MIDLRDGATTAPPDARLALPRSTLDWNQFQGVADDLLALAEPLELSARVGPLDPIEPPPLDELLDEPPYDDPDNAP